MAENKKLKGPWVQHLGIIFLSLILGGLLSEGQGGRHLSRNFIRALPAGRNFSVNAINAVTFAIRCCRSANIAETKRQIGCHK